MDGFLKRSAAERAFLFEQASDQIGLAAGAVEKDFWVCWALRQVFRLEAGSSLAFKGGTSLSKCYKIIERFSEDIDLVIEREFLGFGGDRAPEAAESGNERKRRVKAVVAASQSYVGGTMLPELESASRDLVESERLRIVRLDPDTKDGQAILVEYVSVFGQTGYVRPIVKLELGARSATEPSSTTTVQPYLVGFPGHGLSDSDCRVRVVAAERTFWDKVALVHEEAFEAEGPRPRLARHYYDIWCMHRGEIADRALADPTLFERVVEHRILYFTPGREARDTLRRGSIRLLPEKSRMKDWRADFNLMRESMFFGEVPEFDKIVDELRPLERRINLES